MSIKATVVHVLKKERVNVSVSVHVVVSARIRRLNREHRGKDAPTDVLSFGGLDLDSGDLGDLFICLEQIRRQAREWGETYKGEFLRMLIHGTLHILGYDHVGEKEAEVMFSRQEKYLEEVKKKIR